MAQDYLMIQATSVTLEQVFSVTENVITKTWNHLLPEIVRAYLYVKS